MTDGGAREHFRPDIEGLRAFAIIVVVAFHAAVPGFHGGFIGVDVFFVLSGYLITSLLTRELEQTGRVDFRRFYARRIRRLLPGASLALIATMLAARVIASPLEQTAFAGAAIATALYVSNFLFAKDATDYLGDSGDTNPLLHTWSLAVEEQFYAFWPALLMAVYHRDRRPLRALAIAVGVVTLVSLGASIWLTGVAQPWAFFSSPTRAWEFGIGALASMVRFGDMSAGARLRDVAGWAAMLVLAATVFAYTRLTPFPGIAALVPALATAVLLTIGSQRPASSVSRVLGLGPLRWIGTMSYSWYLWHWPVLVLAQSYYGPLPLKARLFWAAVSLGLAVVAYYAVENPLRSSTALAAVPARSLRLAAALATSCAALGLAWGFIAGRDAASPAQHAIARAHDDLAVVYVDGCHLSYLETRSPACIYGDASGTRTLVLFGDSHAAQWFPALDAIAKEGRFRLISLTKAGCPAADVAVYEWALQRPYPECDAWRRTTLERIVRLHPAAVFASSANVYVAGAHSAAPHSLSSEEWVAGTRRLAARLHAAGIAVVIIADAPSPGVDVPTCLSRAVWRGASPVRVCSVPRAAAIRDDLIAAIRNATRGEATNANLNGAICVGQTCPPELGGRVVYRDGNHLTASFVAAMAPLLLQQSRAALSDPPPR